MNWYKKAQSKEIIYEIEDLSGLDNITSFLQKNGFQYELIDFPTGKQVLVFGDYIIDDFEYPTPKIRVDWLSDIRDNKIEDFYPIKDFNDEFWENEFPLYHATKENSLQSIMKDGLTKQNQSRAIENRSTPSAVFTSDNPDDISSYGNIVLEINTTAMKQDGYMPVVSKESPIEYAEYIDAIANKIGLDDYHYDESYISEGIYSSTVVVFGNIPPKYLRIK